LGLLASISAVLVAACASHPDASRATQHADDAGKLCVAIRGNGQAMLAHFGALARITEHYGVVDGLAGGSSTSITMFIYQSMLQNPALDDCTEDGGEFQACEPEQRAARLALLLKSMQVYVEAVGTNDGLLNNPALKEFAESVRAEPIEQLLSDPTQAEKVANAAALLTRRLDPDALGRIGVNLNSELAKMLAPVKSDGSPRSTAELAYNANEVYQSVANLGKFSVPNNRLFFRLGLIDWQKAPLVFGHAGDFYAGNDPNLSADMKSWLDTCAEKTVGRTWWHSADSTETSDDIAHTVVDGVNCADAFWKAPRVNRRGVLTAPASGLAANFLSDLQKHVAFTASRIDESIGDKKGDKPVFPVLAVTSLLTGDSVKAYEDALEVYRSGTVAAPPLPKPGDPAPTEPPRMRAGEIKYAGTWTDVKVGYWGPADVLDALTAGAARYSTPNTPEYDPKTAKTRSLGDRPWSEILGRSPAEPGLAPAQPFKDKDGNYNGGGDFAGGKPVYSLGGWPDLIPVVALKNSLCGGPNDRVIYLTRQDASEPETKFAVQIAAQLGLEGDELKAYYDPQGVGDDHTPPSSYNFSLSKADAVYCTRWNDFSPVPVEVLFNNAYDSPLHAKDASYDTFAKPADGFVKAPNLDHEATEPGCAPGVGPLPPI
jgi:hypothetical protein